MPSDSSDLVSIKSVMNIHVFSKFGYLSENIYKHVRYLNSAFKFILHICFTKYICTIK